MSVSTMCVGVLAAAAGGGVTYDLGDLAASYSDSGAATALYSVNFYVYTDGTIDVFRTQASNLLDEQDPYTSDVASCWVRMTHNSGTNWDAGSGTGTWLACTSNRNWLQVHSSGGGSDFVTGNFTIELSSDSGGSTIEASHTFTVTVGELF